MSGLTISAIGTVGLYVARISEQIKQWPLHVLQDGRQQGRHQPAQSEFAMVHRSGAG
jgi:hypothetical protein